MYAFFDKYGKKILVVAMALLMVTFLLPSNAFNSHARAGRAGTLDGQPINQYEVEQESLALQQLDRVYVPDQRTGRAVPITQARFGGLYKQLTQDKLTWYLLVLEARKAGVFPSDDAVESFIGPGAVYLPNTGKAVELNKINPTIHDRLFNNIRVTLQVTENFYRSMRSVKITQPMVDDALAQAVQQVRARVAVFSASDYADKVAAPTQAELETQFKAYADVFEGTSPGNPFGFGYRVRDRIKLQYFTIPDAEVTRAIIATRSADRWEEDARIYYLNNKERFAEMPAPEVGPTTQPAATQPVTPPFSQISEKVYAALRQPLIEQRRKSIVARISSQLAADHQKASDNFTATTQKVKDSAIGSDDYLRKIRDDVQQQFGVTISLTIEATLMDEPQVASIPGLGAGQLEQENRDQDRISSISYLFDACKPLAREQRVVAPIDLYQPARPIRGENATYVVRMVDASVNHPAASLDEVRAKVEADVKRKHAFNLASEAAAEALKVATASGLGSIQGKTVESSDWFGMPQTIAPGFTLPMPIPGLAKDSDAFSSQLVTPIFNLQRGLRSVSELPKYDVIKLPGVDKAVVAELFDVRTRLTTDRAERERLMAGAELMQTFVTGDAIRSWFDRDAVFKRVGYVPGEDEVHQSQDDKKPRPAPGSPFIPG